jgi:GMP synthase-like glutamine amidotransferase
MRALVIQHVAVEGPGVLEPLLRQHGWQLETVALYAGAQLPEQPQSYQAILVLGGPMGVDDEVAYPFLRTEHHFLQQAIAQEVPLLGICLGSQLLAKALGARVYRNPCKEIGWYTVELSPATRTDPLFTGVASPLQVFQWHGDAFDLPSGATALASSPLCTHQAFRYGKQVYGVLFHLEVTPETIRTWLATFTEELVSVRSYIDPERILADMPRYLEAYRQSSTQVWTNLMERLWTPWATRGTGGP